METIYRDVVDREGWGSGGWDNEPDKVEWLDLVTGLPCIALRSQFGSWCGYVGVDKSHCLYGIGYSDAVELDVDIMADLLDARGVLNLYEDDLMQRSVRLESISAVHGGVTFADGETKISTKEWKDHARYLKNSEAEAKGYPVGDAARRIKEWDPLIQDYELWRDRMVKTRICHGEAPNHWWFGFDCAHAGDLAPGLESTLRSVGSGGHSTDKYRELSYVQNECAELAAQLKSIAESA